MNNRLALVVRTCAAGALALFVAANASAGVVFRGAIDPIFGAFIPGASFTGEAFFDVDPDCLAVDGTYTNADACGILTILSATITLTNSPNSQTLDFGTNLSSPDPVIDYIIANGTLAAVDTINIGPQFVAAVPDIGYTGPMWLSLGHTGVAGDGLTATGQLHPGSSPEGCFIDPDPTHQSTVATVTITRVPEPATIALLLAAMGALWIVRRRRPVKR